MLELIVRLFVQFFKGAVPMHVSFRTIRVSPNLAGIRGRLTQEELHEAEKAASTLIDLGILEGTQFTGDGKTNDLFQEDVLID